MEDLHQLQPKTVETAQQPQTVETKATSTDADISMVLLKNAFDMDITNRDDGNQLKWIYNFYDKMGVQDMNDVLFDIQNIKAKLGNPGFGVSRLGQVYQYLKILSQMTQLDQAKKGMEHAT